MGEDTYLVYEIKMCNSLMSLALLPEVLLSTNQSQMCKMASARDSLIIPLFQLGELTQRLGVHGKKKNLALLTLSKNFISKNKSTSSVTGSFQRYLFALDSSHFRETMELNKDICCHFGDFFSGLGGVWLLPKPILQHDLKKDWEMLLSDAT